MKKLSASDIALNVIRFGLIAAIVVTVVMRFTSNGAVTTISINDVESAPLSSSDASTASSSAATGTAKNSSSGLININTATASQLTALNGIGEIKAAAIVEYRRQHGNFSSVDDLLNVRGISEKILEGLRDQVTVGAPSVTAASAGTTHEITQDYSSGLININTATASQLTALNGIGESRAAAIVEYREQHGDFGSVDDLLNVPGIGEKILEGLRDQVTVGAPSVTAASTGTTHEITQDYNSGLININTATASQLTALNGIGETKAAAIVEYRRQHGDFGSVDELLNVPGIGEKILEGLRDQVTVGAPSVTADSAGTTHEITQDYSSGLININTATASQLTALNGIGETKAAAIVEYREQHGRFTSVDELLNVRGIGEKTLANIRGQITV